jgi:archaellum component FlaC
MEKLDCHIWCSTPAVGDTLKAMRDKINELVSEINELKIQLTRVHKDRPDLRDVNPYDLSRARRVNKKRGVKYRDCR